MIEVSFTVARHIGPDGRTGFVVAEDGQQWPRLFKSRAEAGAEVRRVRAGRPVVNLGNLSGNGGTTSAFAY